MWSYRRTAMLGPADQLLVTGSYSSTVAVTPDLLSQPPTTSTRPSARRAVVWEERWSLMLAANDQLLVAGL